MSDLTLHSVLNMPVELLDDPQSIMQYQSRGVEASQRIIKLEEIILNMFEEKLDHWTLRSLLQEAKEFIESTK